MSEEYGYTDSSIPEAEDANPISYPGVKLSPNEHGRFYDDARGTSEARPQPEKTKESRRLRASVRECCEHLGSWFVYHTQVGRDLVPFSP
jgi:hypothetical protein